MEKVFLAGSLLFGGYYIAIISYAGAKSSFSGFWLLLACVCLLGYGYCRLLRRYPTLFGIPAPVKMFLITSCCIGLLLFVSIEARVVTKMSKSNERINAGYVIVLGAKVQGTTITKSLRYRLEEAVAYWEKHPGAMIVVSGGQGAGESISEAEAMYRYLVKAGVSKNRIIKEEESTNTVENLQNSLDILQHSHSPVVVITNGFHLFRAESIAKKMTEREIIGIPAKSDVLLLPNYLVREGFAVMKDWFFGNI